MALPLVAHIPYCTFNHIRKTPAAQEVAWLSDGAVRSAHIAATHTTQYLQVSGDLWNISQGRGWGLYGVSLLPTPEVSDQPRYSSLRAFLVTVVSWGASRRDLCLWDI